MALPAKTLLSTALDRDGQTRGRGGPPTGEDPDKTTTTGQVRVHLTQRVTQQAVTSRTWRSQDLGQIGSQATGGRQRSRRQWKQAAGESKENERPQPTSICAEAGGEELETKHYGLNANISSV